MEVIGANSDDESLKEENRDADADWKKIGYVQLKEEDRYIAA